MQLLLTQISNYNLTISLLILAIISISMMVLKILKLKFYSKDKTDLSNKILTSLDDIIILFDKNMNIKYINQKGLDTIEDKNKSVIKKKIINIIPEYEKISCDIIKIFKGYRNNISCKIYLKKSSGKQVLIDARMSVLHDSSNNPDYILIKGQEIKEIKNLKELKKITKREEEIIQLLILGKTNTNIAYKLGITQNTIKRHITNIYSKLFVRNKIELLNYLKDYNLIPEQKAEKQLLLIRR